MSLGPFELLILSTLVMVTVVVPLVLCVLLVAYRPQSPNMRLVSCPHCKYMVPQGAAACPNCHRSPG